MQRDKTRRFEDGAVLSRAVWAGRHGAPPLASERGATPGTRGASLRVEAAVSGVPIRSHVCRADGRLG